MRPAGSTHLVPEEEGPLASPDRALTSDMRDMVGDMVGAAAAPPPSAPPPAAGAWPSAAARARAAAKGLALVREPSVDASSKDARGWLEAALDGAAAGPEPAPVTLAPPLRWGVDTAGVVPPLR